jgi:hypothetical protein
MTAANDLAVRRALESAGNLSTVTAVAPVYASGNTSGRSLPSDRCPATQSATAARMPNACVSVAEQDWPQAARPRQAEVMDLRAAGVEFMGAARR